MLKYIFIGIVLGSIALGIVVLQCAKGMHKPDFISAEMASAIIQARKSLPQFRDRLAKRQPPDEAFFIRVRFQEKGVVEVLWLSHVKISGDGFEGTVAEAPNLIGGLHKGDVKTVAEAQVVDWTIKREGGGRDGDYTQGLEPGAH